MLGTRANDLLTRTRDSRFRLDVMRQRYTAVLLNTDLGKKVVLFRPQPGAKKERLGGWYFKIYDN